MNRWSQEQIDLLKELYPKVPTRELAEHFPDRTLLAIKCRAIQLRLEKKNKRCFLTREQVDFVEANFAKMHTADLVKEMGCTHASINNTAYRLGLKKDRSVLSDNGRKLQELGKAYRFTKGHLSFNKGQKQSDFMSEEAIERTKATRFKKGQVPPNYRQLGTERVTKDGYIEIKAKSGLQGWRLKHRVIWEEANGEIGKSEIIQFRDGNRVNFSLDNLEKIHRSEQIKSNTIVQYPKELQDMIKLKNRVKRNIKSRRDD